MQCPARREMSQQSRAEEEESFRKLTAGRGEEEARYAKFVYDITQEIVQNSLYTDRELKQVFEKHLQRNSGCLNKVRLIYNVHFSQKKLRYRPFYTPLLITRLCRRWILYSDITTSPVLIKGALFSKWMYRVQWLRPLRD